MDRFGYDTTAEEVARLTDLRGRIAVLAGASSGIGVETARGQIGRAHV
jgi:NADP-dependent 3-hydroxy acid dehydrogenase YdfG